MAKFATPVAMRVTKEEGIELVKSLAALGYRYIHKKCVGYITTGWNGEHNLVTILEYKPQYRHILEEYNPELFLAISAMTEGDIPIKGEWIYFDIVSKIFQVRSFGAYNNWESGRISLDNPTGSGHFHKPTIQQLEKHFKNSKETFELPKKWKLEVTEENVDAVNKWKKSIGRCATVTPGDAVEQNGYWCRGIFTINTVITTEQFMEHVYKPAFNIEIPEEFYVKYCEGFTEDIFNELRIWSAKNGDIGGEANIFIGYAEFIRQDKTRYFLFEKDCPNGDWSFGIDNNVWDYVKTEYTLEQVKKLINYKPKTNKNECKEENGKEWFESIERDSREIKQIDEDLDSISSREGGKEIKIRTVSSRNLCQRGSIESSNSITSPGGNSNRLRAERGRLYI